MEALKTIKSEETIIELQIGEAIIPVTIKQHIDYADRRAILDGVEQAYFSDGELDKLRGNTVINMLVLQAYTSLDFEGDVDAFEKFYNYLIGTGNFEKIYGYNVWPDEAARLERYITQTVDFLRPKYNNPPEESLFYSSCFSLVDSLNQLVERLDETLTAASGALTNKGDINVSEIIEAMKLIGRKDEKKIAKAVLDFQAEKAKRAERTEKTIIDE